MDRRTEYATCGLLDAMERIGGQFRFRALSLAEAAYPYLAGGSNTVIVRKR